MDVLQRISDEDLQLLANLYEKHQSRAYFSWTMLMTCIAWRKKKPEEDYLQFFGINNDWLKSGTFILIWEYGSNAIFLSTLEDSHNDLYKALTQTKIIDWNKQTTWIAVDIKIQPTVLDILKELKIMSVECLQENIWTLEKEKALEFEIRIPDDVYLKKLDKSHTKLVDFHWPHKHKGSDIHLGEYIEMETSYGLFLKSNDSLVCWILKCFMGCLANLQTLDEHTGKGYGTILARLMSKKIAEHGYHPQGIILEGNIASEKIFAKLGYRKTGQSADINH